MPNLIWIQAGACSGDSMSLLNSENPNFVEFLKNYNIELLWHPSLSLEYPSDLLKTIHKIEKDQLGLNFLCIEGTIANGPNNTGMFDTFMNKPKRDIISMLSQKADFVISMGTCAAYGGIPTLSPNPTDATGLQWLKNSKGGLISPNWKSKKGLPVINLSGCPVHPNIIIQTLLLLALEGTIELDKYNRPIEYYSKLIHQGCTRNEFHEYNLEDSDLSGEGCMYFNLGCQGPVTSGSCNDTLWNQKNSKPRAGVPCIGCTEPFFPQESGGFFTTEKIGNIPSRLPKGVKRANYMAYKGLAKRAAPNRLITKIERSPGERD